MNREIKFRAWDKEKKRMIEVQEMYFNYENRWVVCGEIVDLDAPIMQYTGLKDKNGKEIYEGDIMKYEGGDIVCSIYWDNDQSMYRFTNNVGINSFYPDKSKLEVIGNIYENPELLKEATK